jgi:PAS domain S-box-containing protein
MTSTALSPYPNLLTPHSQPEPVAPVDHIVYFYQRSDSLLDALSEFVGPALGAGNGAVIIATKMHRDGLQERLMASGLDLPLVSKQGRYVALDAPEILSKIMIAGVPNKARFEEAVGAVLRTTKAALKVENPKLAVFGEMVALLWTEGKFEAAIKLEQLWNELSKEQAFSLRCAYPASGFHGEHRIEPFKQVCAEHSSVILDPEEKSLSVGDPKSVHESKQVLMRSEERFRWLVDAVQDYAIFMLDTEGHIISWNTGAARIKGWGVSEIIGKHFSLFYPEADLQTDKPRRHLEIAARDGRVEDEGWRIRKDGSRFWANVVISAIRDQNGMLVGFGKVTRDFSERIRTNELLRREIVERTEAQRKLSDSEKSLRELSLRLLQTQEMERRRIGRDLHDSVGQYLVGLKMKLDALKSTSVRSKEDENSQLVECAQLAEEAIKEVRTISYLLYPPMLEELGLKSAVPWYLEGFTKRSGIRTTFEVSRDFNRLPDDVELALFRVLQECLTNVHRHSDSATAKIQLLTEDGTVILKIIDEGKGIHPENWDATAPYGMRAFGVGLRGMRERLHQLGGSLELNSTAGGTTVTAKIPVPETGTAQER